MDSGPKHSSRSSADDRHGVEVGGDDGRGGPALAVVVEAERALGDHPDARRRQDAGPAVAVVGRDPRIQQPVLGHLGGRGTDRRVESMINRDEHQARLGAQLTGRSGDAGHVGRRDLRPACGDGGRRDEHRVDAAQLAEERNRRRARRGEIGQQPARRGSSR